jgi:hypothetical protein
MLVNPIRYRVQPMCQSYSYQGHLCESILGTHEWITYNSGSIPSHDLEDEDDDESIQQGQRFLLRSNRSSYTAVE